MTKQTALTPVKKLEIGLAGEKKDITSLLANTNISPARFMRVAVTAFENSDVKDCTIESVIKACKQAAQDGLVIDNKEAALVRMNVKVSKRGEPDKWEPRATYMPMVYGVIKKVTSGPEIEKITSRVVREGDVFEVSYGTNEFINHIPDFKNPGKLVCAYAVAFMSDGSTQFDVMSKDEIMQAAMSSKSGTDANGNLKGIWKKWESEMWRKTPVKRLAKYLPVSSDVKEFLDYDNKVDSPEEIEINSAPGPEKKPETKPAKKKATRTKAAAAILEQQDEPIEGELMPEDDGPAPTQPVDDVDDVI